jgi:selenocysteine lyase/cysteine desulfurase
MAKHYTSVNGHGLATEIPILHDILNTFKCANDLDPSDRLFRLVMDKVKSLDIHRENTLLIMDQTTSNTAINFPIEKIATAAKREGMLVAVDGAHGLLAHELNLKALAKAGLDFYISNCHKWFCSPRGAAFLYCGSASLRDTILRRPAIVSHGIDDGYHSRFIWDGCRDYSAQLTLPIVIQFWNQLGPQRVQTIMRTNLTNAIQLLAHKWYPEHNFGSDLEKITTAGVMIVPLSLHSPMVRMFPVYELYDNVYSLLHIFPFQALVRLPCKKPRVYTSTDAKVIQDFLFSRMIEAPIKCVEGSLYVRISSHVYNTLEHYDKLGNAIASCNLLI